ncbi:MAG: hypothetical protein SNJ64_01840 [Endomicrobiia bacterium]
MIRFNPCNPCCSDNQPYYYYYNNNNNNNISCADLHNETIIFEIDNLGSACGPINGLQGQRIPLFWNQSNQAWHGVYGTIFFYGHPHTLFISLFCVGENFTINMTWCRIYSDENIHCFPWGYDIYLEEDHSFRSNSPFRRRYRYQFTVPDGDSEQPCSSGRREISFIIGIY